MTSHRLQLRHVSLSLACLLSPRQFAYPVSATAHKLQRQNARKWSVSTEAGQQSSMSLHYSKPIIQTPREQHTSTIIMLHGLGDSGAGWSDFGAEYGSTLPHVKWIFPNAPNVRTKLALWFCLREVYKQKAQRWPR